MFGLQSNYLEKNSASFRRFSFSTLLLIMMLSSNKINKGTATKVWLIQSGDGVITAATNKMIT